MTQNSFPIVGVNIPHAQWRSIFDAGQAGIIGADGSATGNAALGFSGDLRLTLSSTTDVATVGVGRVQYRGFCLEVSAGEALTLAAVTTTAKTYSVGVMYDPAREGTNPGGPLYLYAALNTAISIPASGSFLKLYDVTRQPSQTLNLAAVVDWRSYLGPRYWGPAASQPAAAPLGATISDGVEEYLRVRNTNGTGGAWINLDDPPWIPLTFTGSGWSAVAGYPLQGRRVRNDVQIQGAGRSAASGITQQPLTLPPSLHPTANRFYASHLAGRTSGGTGFDLLVTASGALIIDTNYIEGGVLLPNATYPLSGSFPI